MRPEKQLRQILAEFQAMLDRLKVAADGVNVSIAAMDKMKAEFDTKGVTLEQLSEQYAALWASVRRLATHVQPKNIQGVADNFENTMREIQEMKEKYDQDEAELDKLEARLNALERKKIEIDDVPLYKNELSCISNEVKHAGGSSLLHVAKNYLPSRMPPEALIFLLRNCARGITREDLPVLYSIFRLCVEEKTTAQSMKGVICEVIQGATREEFEALWTSGALAFLCSFLTK